MYGNQLISPYWLNRANPWYVAFNGPTLFFTLPHYAVACNRSDVTITCQAMTNFQHVVTYFLLF
jgi:hypothetical protein